MVSGEHTLRYSLHPLIPPQVDGGQFHGLQCCAATTVKYEELFVFKCHRLPVVSSKKKGLHKNAESLKN